MTFYELPKITASLQIMRIIKLFLIITFSLSISAETVYKTRDAEGNISFSDVAMEGAEKIQIQEAQTLNLPMPKRQGERPATKLSPATINYSQFKIINPEHDSTIHSNEGTVNISSTLTPALDEKHAIVFLMDGKEVSKGKSLQLSLSNLNRGTHGVTAMIKDEKDNVLKQSNKITFHLRKASKLFKNRVNNEVANSADNPTPAAPDVPAL